MLLLYGYYETTIYMSHIISLKEYKRMIYMNVFTLSFENLLIDARMNILCEISILRFISKFSEHDHKKKHSHHLNQITLFLLNLTF